MQQLMLKGEEETMEEAGMMTMEEGEMMTMVEGRSTMELRDIMATSMAMVATMFMIIKTTSMDMTRLKHDKP